MFNVLPENNKIGTVKAIIYNDHINQPCSTQSEKVITCEKLGVSNEEIIEFFLYHFKCFPCLLEKEKCKDKLRCEGWHYEGERRRNPGVAPNFAYSEEPCPNLKITGKSKWPKEIHCQNGDTCPYSHTLMEQMYHPNIYKTSLCANFASNRGDKCQWGYFCTHAHGQKDIRHVIKTKKLFSNKQKPKNHFTTEISTIDNQNSFNTIRQTNFDSSNALTKSSNIVSSNTNQQSTFSPQYDEGNYSPSNISSHQSTIMPNSINNSSGKYSPLPPNGPAKQFSNTITPNSSTCKSYYCASQTFPNHYHNEKQQFSWDLTSNGSSNNISTSQAPSSYNYNYESSPRPPISIAASQDIYYRNNCCINQTDNMSPNLTPDSYSNVGQDFTSNTHTINNSPLQIPKQLPNAGSQNVSLSTLKLHKLEVIIPSNPINHNQFLHYKTPSYAMGYPSKYLTQLQNVNVETDVFHQNNNIALLPTIDNGNKKQDSRNDTLLQKQSIPFQTQPEILQSNAINFPNLNLDNGHESLPTDINHNISYYFFGDNSLVGPMSNEHVHSSTTQTDNHLFKEDIVNQLQSQINDIKKELELEKEKNRILNESCQQYKVENLGSKTFQVKNNDNQQDQNNISNEFKNGIPQEQIDLFERYMKCPGCDANNVSRSNVLIPCGHVICRKCVPHESGLCPVCFKNVNKIPQKLTF